MRCGHRNLRASDNTYSIAGIYPVIVRHNDSTKNTRMITMITLTQDKYALVKVSFSM
jgi:hypothetical protein